MTQKANLVETQKVEIPVAKIEIDPIAAIIGDPEAKKMGPAKGGGCWYKNKKSGILYRVIEKDGKPELAETKQGVVPAGKSQAKKSSTGGPTRGELMEEAKARKIKYFRILSKNELLRAIAKETTSEELANILAAAVKRWKSGAESSKKKADRID